MGGDPVDDRRAARRAPGRSRSRAIGLDGQGPTLVAAAADGRPIAPGDHLAGRAVGRRGGGPAPRRPARRGWVLGILPKALWVERHRSRGAADARWYLASWEWVGLRLTGVAAETTLPGQVHPGSRRHGARTGLAVDRIPPSVASAGRSSVPLLAGPAAELGLDPGIPVVAGMADAHASFLGAGLLEPGDAIDTGGTSGGFAVYTDRPIDDPRRLRRRGADPRPVVPRRRDERDRARRSTGCRDDVLGRRPGATGSLAEALAVEPGADGLVFLPYLAGRAIADLGPDGARCVRRPDPAPWSGAPRPGGPRGGRPRAPPRRRADRGGRRHRSASCACRGGWPPDPRAQPAQGRRDRVHRRGPGHRRDGASVGSAIAAGTGIGAFPDLAHGIRSVVRIDDRIDAGPGRRADLRRRLRDVRRALPRAATDVPAAGRARERRATRRRTSATGRRAGFGQKAHNRWPTP